MVHSHGDATTVSSILALTPLWLHMLLVLVAGLYLPKELVSWFQAVASVLG